MTFLCCSFFLRSLLAGTHLHLNHLQCNFLVLQTLIPADSKLTDTTDLLVKIPLIVSALRESILEKDCIDFFLSRVNRKFDMWLETPDRISQWFSTFRWQIKLRMTTNFIIEKLKDILRKKFLWFKQNFFWSKKSMHCYPIKEKFLWFKEISWLLFFLWIKEINVCVVA